MGWRTPRPPPGPRRIAGAVSNYGGMEDPMGPNTSDRPAARPRRRGGAGPAGGPLAAAALAAAGALLGLLALLLTVVPWAIGMVDLVGAVVRRI